jgi:hypothetical protein
VNDNDHRYGDTEKQRSLDLLNDVATTVLIANRVISNLNFLPLNINVWRCSNSGKFYFYGQLIDVDDLE